MYPILTCADTNFYGMAVCLARVILSYPDCRLFLYDLGLTASEKSHLERLGVTIEKTVFDEDTFSMNSRGNIRTTHKIDCIAHFIGKYASGVVVLDADAIPVIDCIGELFPGDDEIVVTYRCDRERKPHILINGKINAGVMAFGKHVGDDFFGAWKHICDDREQTDQSGLSKLLEQEIRLEDIGSRQRFGAYTVRVLDGNIYNDVTCRIGRIFHFKNAGRQFNKRLGFGVFAWLHRLFPELVAFIVALNRKYRLFVWRP